MLEHGTFKLDLAHFGIPKLDPGWIYAVRTRDLVKVGKTTDPQRRLLREANTWCPNGLDETIVKPFWNIRRLEYSLHSALAPHWHRGEWHKFENPRHLAFFVDAFKEFKDSEEFRDKNSVDFTYWMQGTGYAEVIHEQCEHSMSLPEWRKHRADPWRFTRDKIMTDIRRQCGISDAIT